LAERLGRLERGDRLVRGVDRLDAVLAADEFGGHTGLDDVRIGGVVDGLARSALDPVRAVVVRQASGGRAAAGRRRPDQRHGLAGHDGARRDVVVHELVQDLSCWLAAAESHVALERNRAGDHGADRALHVHAAGAGANGRLELGDAEVLLHDPRLAAHAQAAQTGGGRTDDGVALQLVERRALGVLEVHLRDAADAFHTGVGRADIVVVAVLRLRSGTRAADALLADGTHVAVLAHDAVRLRRVRAHAGGVALVVGALVAVVHARRGGQLEETGGRAAVTVHGVAVVALLGEFRDAVAAEGRLRRCRRRGVGRRL